MPYYTRICRAMDRRNSRLRVVTSRSQCCKALYMEKDHISVSYMHIESCHLKRYQLVPRNPVTMLTQLWQQTNVENLPKLIIKINQLKMFLACFGSNMTKEVTEMYENSSFAPADCANRDENCALSWQCQGFISAYYTIQRTSDKLSQTEPV